jgi:hypothetical protein
MEGGGGGGGGDNIFNENGLTSGQKINDLASFRMREAAQASAPGMRQCSFPKRKCVTDIDSPMNRNSMFQREAKLQLMTASQTTRTHIEVNARRQSRCLMLAEHISRETYR